MPAERFKVGDEVVIRPLTQTIGALRGRQGTIKHASALTGSLTITLTDDPPDFNSTWKKGDEVYVSPWEVARK